MSLSMTKDNPILLDQMSDFLAEKVTDFQIDFVSQQGIDVSVHESSLENVTHQLEHVIYFDLYRDARRVSGSINSREWSVVSDYLSGLIARLQWVQEDPCVGLPDPACMATQIVDCDLDHPWVLTTQEAIAQSVDLAKQSVLKDSDLRCDSAALSSLRTEWWLLNSRGFSNCLVSTRHSRSCTLMLNDAKDPQMDGDYTVSRSAELLLPNNELAQLSADQVLKRRDPKTLPSGVYDVVFSPAVARQFWSHLVSAISGGALYRQASFLCNQLNTSIFPSWLTIQSQPFIPGALGSAPYDNEGVAPLSDAIVEQGVLKKYLLSSYSARRLGMSSTGVSGGIQNWLVEASFDGDAKALCTKMQRGLYITDMMGQGVDLATGHYSRGAFGYWVENGEIQYPVHELTLAGELSILFLGLRAAGNDIDTRGKIRCGSLWLSDVSVAGKG